MATVESTPPSVRPTAAIEPPAKRGALAVAALGDGRLADAAKHIQAMDEATPLERAWKLSLAGRLAVAKTQWDQAEGSLLRAFAVAHVECRDAKDVSDAARLCIHVLTRVGWIHRRKERAAQARRYHLAAFDLAERSGSFDELWEIATELGLDAEVLGDYADARTWHQRAVTFGERAGVEPVRLQAAACGNLSRILLQGGAADQATAIAEKALGLWRQFDPGALEVPRAERRLGECMLKQAETMVSDRPETARGLLDEALGRLNAAREALEAFGPAGAVDAESCAETIDFATRLRMTVEV